MDRASDNQNHSRRIGVFGGSFDPIHVGHLWIAEAAIESLELTEVRWIPAAQSPLKPAGPIATDQDRLQMIRLAVSGCENYVVDDREIRRGEISYSVDTMTELRAEFPDAQLWMIIGSDSLASMPRWHQPERLLKLVRPAVVQRGGEQTADFSVLEGLVDPEELEQIRHSVIRMPLIEVSSSELRERIAAGRSIRFRTPRAVEALIEDRGLYRTNT